MSYSYPVMQTKSKFLKWTLADSLNTLAQLHEFQNTALQSVSDYLNDYNR